MRKTCKSQPCVKLACVINADHVPISHVSGSHQVGRALHEVIIFIIIVTRQRCGGSMCSACTEPVVRSDGWYCTRRTCYAAGVTHMCRYARRSSRSRAKDATSCMTMDGLASGLIEASRAIAPGRQPRDSAASPLAPKAGVLRMRYVDEDASQTSSVQGHTEAWKLAEHELMHMPRVGERGCTRSKCNG